MVDIADPNRGAKLAHDLTLQGPGRAEYCRADLTKPIELFYALRRPVDVYGEVATVVIGNAGMVVKDDDPRVSWLSFSSCSKVITKLFRFRFSTRLSLCSNSTRPLSFLGLKSQPT